MIDAHAGLGSSGVVFDVRRYAVHDGPGIRTTVFLKGCPLRCAWCHNPESQSPHPQLLVRASRCLRCGACVAACPHGALELRDDRVLTNGEACTLCGACVAACPAEARETIGVSMTVADVLREVERDRLFYEGSGGGVTFSGGEPLAQSAFLLGLLRAGRERGLHTALDTCGHAPADVFERAVALTDLVLFDVKHADSERHREGTGVGNERILDNLRRLAASGVDCIVRVPLVPGFNDAEDDLCDIAALVAALPRVPPVQLLPFHTAAEDKHRRFGLPYRRFGDQHLDGAALAACLTPFDRFGVAAQIGGG
jgi:pyruvate formate lyase activating enzyme